MKRNIKLPHDEAINEAKRLLDEGMQITEIIQITGLSQNDIKQIKEKSYK